MSLRSGLVVAIADAAPLVDRWRERTCEARPSAGVPPHVTLLFPFAPAREIDDALIAEVARVLEEVAPFDLRFERTGRFPGVLYLAPQQDAALRALSAALVARFPAYPPYEGLFGTDLVPHLTVAQGDDATLDAAARDVERGLPVGAHVHEALLFEEVEPDHAAWQERARFPFRGGR
jgi:2'-5' RNA ligase